MISDLPNSRRDADDIDLRQLELEAIDTALPDKEFPERRWTRKRRLQVGAGVASLFVLAAAWFIPFSRHAVLNAAGAKAHIVVVGSGRVDRAAEDTVIKNFSVEAGDTTYRSGTSERLSVWVPYGESRIRVFKLGYAESILTVTAEFDPFFGFGGKVEPREAAARLQAHGQSVSFIAKDWVSGEPIRTGEFRLGDTTARPDMTGRVSFTISPQQPRPWVIEATFREDFQSRSFQLDLAALPAEVTFVPAKRHYFMAQKGGTINVYSMLVDGSDLKEFIKGTPAETQAAQFAVSPDGKYAAFVSSRLGERDEQGFIQQVLYRVNLSNGNLDQLDRGRHIVLHDWYETSIVYTATTQEVVGEALQHRLRSATLVSKNRSELGGGSGAIGPVYVALGTVIFAQADSGRPGVTIRKVSLGGENGRDLAAGEAELRQISYDEFAYKLSDGQWHVVNINTSEVKKQLAAPPQSVLFLAQPSGRNDRIGMPVDGTGAGRGIFIRFADGTVKDIISQRLRGQVRFLTPTSLIFRINSGSAAIDYVVSTTKGEPKRMTESMVTAHTDRQFFTFY